MIDALIERMDRWLMENRPEYHARLRPGVPADVLAAFERRFSLELPAGYRALYRWRNGQGDADSSSLYDNWMFSSLDAVSASKAMLDDMIGTDFEDPAWWRRGWVPFLSNGGGDYLCLDLDAEGGSTPGQVVTFWHDWESRPVRHPSLVVWLSDLVMSMESGTLQRV